MAVAVAFLDIAELERPGQPTVVAQELVQPLARKRQKRGEDQLQGVDDPQRDEEDGGGSPPVMLDHRPRRLMVDVLVPDARQPHGLGERGPEARLLDEFPDRVEARGDGGERRLVGLRQRPRRGHLAEVAIGVRQRSVDEVAPVREELVVVPAQELRPREVAVLRLGAGRGEEIADRVRVVAF